MIFCVARSFMKLTGGGSVLLGSSSAGICTSDAAVGACAGPLGGVLPGTPTFVGMSSGRLGGVRRIGGVGRSGAELGRKAVAGALLALLIVSRTCASWRSVRCPLATHSSWTVFALPFCAY